MSAPLFLKSDPINFAANGQRNVKLDFLQSALTGFKNPVIDELKFLVHVDADTGSSGGLARQFPMMIASAVLQDGAGERVNLKGSSLRIAAHAEMSGQYRDGYNIAASQTSAEQDIFLPILPCLVQDEYEENDHGILVSDIMNGGSLDVNFGAALTFTNHLTFTTDSYVQVWASVREAKTRQGKVRLAPRLCWKNTTMSQAEFRYDVKGVARWLIAYVGDQAEDDLTGFSAQNITSDTLGLYAFTQQLFRDNYRYRGYPCQARGAAGAASTEENPFLTANPQALAVLAPRFGQPISELPVLDTCQLNTSLSSWGSDSPQFIRAFYTPRSPALEAAALGTRDAGKAQARIAAAGRIGNGSTPASASDASRILPVDVG